MIQEQYHTVITNTRLKQRRIPFITRCSSASKPDLTYTNQPQKCNSPSSQPPSSPPSPPS